MAKWFHFSEVAHWGDDVGELIERHLGRCERCNSIDWSILKFAIPLSVGDSLGVVCNNCGALHVKTPTGAFGLLTGSEEQS